MAGDYSDVMSTHTDKELIDILTTHRNQYQEKALLAAEAEVERRKIDPEQITQAMQRLTPEDQELFHKANQHFTLFHIVITFLLPFVIITVLTWLFNALKLAPIKQFIGFPSLVLIYYLIHRGYKNNGYLKMAQDFFKWVVYSLYIYIGLLLIVGLIVITMMMYNR